MFMDLETLRPDLKPMFGRLRKAAEQAVAEMRQKYPYCPESYWAFMMERGSGALEQDGEPFFFVEQLLSAESEIYRDRQIYENGAKGDVMIFGYESMGTTYGFDTGNDWKLVEIDEFRIVTPLDLTFKEFVVGLVLCYPQIAIRVENREWVDGLGNRYKPNAEI
jgi:hypothetical protein